jgi:hypothetical protein
LEKCSLTPIFLRTRTNRGTIEERITSAIKTLEERRNQVESERGSIEHELSQAWPTRALDLAPGTLILKRVAKRYNVSFSKEKGDGERLARNIPATHIDSDIRDLLNEISQD